MNSTPAASKARTNHIGLHAVAADSFRFPIDGLRPFQRRMLGQVLLAPTEQSSSRSALGEVIMARRCSIRINYTIIIDFRLQILMI